MVRTKWSPCHSINNDSRGTGGAGGTAEANVCENNQQTGEEVLLSVVDGLEDDKLSSFALRLALTGHADIPRENEIDHLAEAEAVFAPPQPKKAKAKKATPKKAAKKPTPVKGKSAKKKTATKRLAA